MLKIEVVSRTAIKGFLDQVRSLDEVVSAFGGLVLRALTLKPNASAPPVKSSAIIIVSIE